MKPVLTALFLSVLAVPAMAGTISFDMPNLTFPQTPTSDVTQSCANPTTLGTALCPNPSK